MSESFSQIARREKLALDEQRRLKHLPIARALLDPAQSVAIIDSALEQVRLWRSRQLCSVCYIEAWEKLLKDPEKTAELLKAKDPWAVQLRQNSPFVGVIRHLV